jgi:hypothetical protein
VLGSSSERKVENLKTNTHAEKYWDVLDTWQLSVSRSLQVAAKLALLVENSKDSSGELRKARSLMS